MLDGKIGNADKLNTKKDTPVLDLTGMKVMKPESIIREKICIDTIAYMYPHWYKKDGVYYYKKTDFMYYELLMSELLREFGLRSVDFYVSRDGKDVFIASRNFKDKSNKYYYYSRMFKRCIEHIGLREIGMDNIKTELKKITTAENAKEVSDELFTLTAVDCFSGQSDRTSSNLMFEKSNGLYHLAPIYDNGYCFKGYRIQEYSSCYQKLYFPYIPDPDDDFTGKYEERTLIIDSIRLNTLRLIRDNLAFYNAICKCLDIDIDEIIKRTNDKHQIKIYKAQRDYIRKYLDKKKKNFELTLSCIEHI